MKFNDLSCVARNQTLRRETRESAVKEKALEAAAKTAKVSVFLI